jgi:hypothetical protein
MNRRQALSTLSQGSFALLGFAFKDSIVPCVNCGSLMHPNCQSNQPTSQSKSGVL